MNDTGTPFYGREQAVIHDERFGDLAAQAAVRLLEELRTAGLRDGTVVDLGCGSGILAARVSDAGYDVLGIDMAPAMIELARAAAPRARFEVGAFADMALPPSVAVTAIGEPINYAMAGPAVLDDFDRFAARVHDALVPGGIFLFDVTTAGRYPKPVERFHDAPGWSLGMHGHEDGDELVREIAIFQRAGDGRYDRVDERHVLRLADPLRVRDALEAAGFTVDASTAYGDASSSPSTPSGGFMVFCAHRPPD